MEWKTDPGMGIRAVKKYTISPRLVICWVKIWGESLHIRTKAKINGEIESREAASWW